MNLRLSVFHSEWLPLLLMGIFSIFWFWPSHTYLTGWGDDPLFVLGVFEHLWAKISLGQFSQMGELPLFHPLRGSLWLSDPYTGPALLSWPLFAILGSSVLTLNLFAWGVQILNFVCMRIWLRDLGLSQYASWGSLLLCVSPWVQEHSAHYQNLFLFLIPLSLWSVQKFFDTRNFRSLFLAVFFTSWIGSWNLYYQIFVNILVLAICLWRRIFLKERLSSLFLLGGLTILIEGLFLSPFLELNRLLGSFDVRIGDVRAYVAQVTSFLGHAKQISLIHWIPFYPKFQVGIEAVGFVGFSGLILLVLGLKQRERLASVALLSYWVSLGPSFVLYWFFYWIPGFASLRAIGRTQILFVLFLIPLLLKIIPQSRFRIPLLILLALEWLPGSGPPRVFIPTDEAVTAWFRMFKDREPLAIQSEIPVRVQREAIRAGVWLSEGYTGRSTVWADFMTNAKRDGVNHSEWLKTSREVLAANSVLVSDPMHKSFLDQQPQVIPLGCKTMGEISHCAYDIRQLPRGNPVMIDPVPIQVEEEGDFDIVTFQALSSGNLLKESVANCARVDEFLFFEKRIFSKRKMLMGEGFLKGPFQKGDTVLKLKLRKHLPWRSETLKRRVRLDCTQTLLTLNAT